MARWQVVQKLYPEFPEDRRWWVNRYPHPEDDGISFNDERWMIDGSPHLTWEDAMKDANRGALLDSDADRIRQRTEALDVLRQQLSRHYSR